MGVVALVQDKHMLLQLPLVMMTMPSMASKVGVLASCCIETAGNGGERSGRHRGR